MIFSKSAVWITRFDLSKQRQRKVNTDPNALPVADRIDKPIADFKRKARDDSTGWYFVLVETFEFFNGYFGRENILNVQKNKTIGAFSKTGELYVCTSFEYSDAVLAV